MTGRARLHIRRQHGQRLLILVHGRDEAIRQVREQLAILVRAIQYFIVDVGYIPHVVHVEAARAQITRHHVERHKHTRMTEVQVVVSRNAADVDADLTFYEWLKLFFGLRQAVIDS